MAATTVPCVATYKPLIESCIQNLTGAREDGDIDSPVLETDCAELVDQIRTIRADTVPEALQIHNAAVETVCRDIVVDIVASVDISEPAFAQVWVLLDVINILSDNELCEPGLGFWLVEELLDSQTIEGCRKVFDYLESRRERMTAKHFKQKNLVILRCCNELLRRLSRAEDTVFCGRVFIFLFQSFPLGDKSSVNLRGEFHVENITTFDPTPVKSEDAIKPMELDTGTPQATSGADTPASSGQAQDHEKAARGTPIPKTAKSEPKEQPPDLDALYPKFWSLQSFFSSPTKLFDSSNMAAFKDGIAQTLSCFKSVSNSSAPSTNPTDVKRSLKRKRNDVDTTSNSTSTFNPKYLTNRDLFDLEIHDIAFRRHILVQALIMIDFLLSLSPIAKAKFEGLTNKSVLYSYILSEEDTKWAQSTRSQIAAYLQQGGNGNEGKFYYRMVDTILSRDKNWVRWKAENCPSISRDGVSPQIYIESRDTLTKLADSARAPLVNPPGATDLAFLSKIEPLEALKHPSKRHQVPSLEEYYRGIERDDLDMDFAMTEEEKKEIEEKKAGKVWRALRASKNRFVMCEKVQYGGDLKALLGADTLEDHGEKGGEVEAEAEDDKDKDKAEGNESRTAERKTDGDDTAQAETQDEGETKFDTTVPEISQPTQQPGRDMPEENTTSKTEDAEMTDMAEPASTSINKTEEIKNGTNGVAQDDADRATGAGGGDGGEMP
ncbi:uncharacterized protein Z519_04579 [Cladophialophora bantiana CBS 173.52]|uniref:Nuclear matrix protein n=1 Tax=Cladophialophora bantiana (strain ATCC 10958 / CBS 173.52 / CDC B-1940 / NIH 8579) TaxID=1442370 RepID=A0A0D2HMM1_CLAB1|nr:uncharacterized protein Z519_04579 [Cladophialophora bantiana CBS 173.52]KIW94603.1 hypothetical protein Z519_04579 [Cladophialophora bantiana CBS 173.52]